MPSGAIRLVQGYEPFALDILTVLYTEDDIITGRKEVPEIWYHSPDGKKRRYFVDIFVPSCNLMIEVKSKWTYERQLLINNIKRKACREQGYDFVFWMFDHSRKLTVIMD